MKHHARILTLNLCYEYPGKKRNLLKKWIKILSEIKGDIIFLQEINYYNVEKLAQELGLKILNLDNYEGTAVLINPHKFTIVTNNSVTTVGTTRTYPEKSEPTHSRATHRRATHRRATHRRATHRRAKTLKKIKQNNAIYIGGIHLDDVPSLPHHIKHLVYNSSEKIPLSYSVDKVLDICAQRRLPRVKAELAKTKSFKRAIIAGDFNEPSHLDRDYNKLKLPVSREFDKEEFVDTFNFKNRDALGYTWPAGGLYKKGPPQRIDMIYTKGIKIANSKLYGETNKWISDHKMVITDVLL